jgi:hypothetical protein
MRRTSKPPTASSSASGGPRTGKFYLAIPEVHSVAADPVKNQVYIPGNKAATTLCGGANGCIAVFTATNDDPGLCSALGVPAHGHGKKGDPVFLRHVCADNNGHPNEN